MNRRDFLRATPIVALAPVAVAEGAMRYNLEPAGHFIFFVDLEKIDIDSFCTPCPDTVPLMPAGSKGGWVIGVRGDVENAVKIFRLSAEAAEDVVAVQRQIKNA